MDKIEMAVVPNNEFKIVSDASIARKLLHDGYRVVDIKPKRGHERETIFVFVAEGGLLDAMHKYIEERKERFSKREEM